AALEDVLGDEEIVAAAHGLRDGALGGELAEEQAQLAVLPEPAMDRPLVAGPAVERLLQRVDLDAGHARAQAREEAELADAAEAEVEDALAGEVAFPQRQQVERARVGDGRSVLRVVEELLVVVLRVQLLPRGLAELAEILLPVEARLAEVVPQAPRRLSWQVRRRREELLHERALHERRHRARL